MIDAIKKQWREFKAARPGRRFEERYWRRKKESDGKIGLGKAAYIALGLACVCVGLILLPAPGPGLLVVAFGLGLLGGEFLFSARWLDWAEPKVRSVFAYGKKLWRRTSPGFRIVIVLVAAAAAMAVSYGMWCLMR